MNILIVEDEQLGYERLAKLLRGSGFDINIVGHTVSIRSTVEWLSAHPGPEVIFMDIELADGQCFDIFSQISVPYPIIFTTSYDEYALRAFQVNSIDYLLKPVRKEELERSLRKWQGFRQGPSAPALQDQMETLLRQFRERPEPDSYRNRFLVKQGQRLFSLDVSEIAWFHAEGKLCFIRTWDNHRYLVDYPLEVLERELDPEQFFRVNRGYLVHIRAIQHISPFFKGKLVLQLHPAAGENDVLVSKEKAAVFKKWLGK